MKKTGSKGAEQNKKERKNFQKKRKIPMKKKREGRQTGRAIEHSKKRKKTKKRNNRKFLDSTGKGTKP